MKHLVLDLLDIHHYIIILYNTSYLLTTKCVTYISSVLNYWLKKGADVNIREQNGRLALHNAAKANHVNCVELFIQSGADVNARDNMAKTPLFAAAENGRYQCIEKLVQLGADVNSQDEENCTALFVVVKKGFHTCLKLMIQSGADVNIRGNRDRTALMEAGVEKDHKSIHILIDSGADVNCTTDTGLTALMFTAWCDQWRESTLGVKRLLSSGAHVNKINKFGQNALKFLWPQIPRFVTRKRILVTTMGRM